MYTILYKLAETKSKPLAVTSMGVKKVRGQSEAALQTGMCDQKL